MNTLIENILKRIQLEVIELKKETTAKKASSQNDVAKLFANRIPKELSKAIFKSNHVLSNKYVTVLYLNDFLYVKPHKINICAAINIPVANTLVRTELETVFIASNPKQRFGKKSLGNEIAIKLVGDIIKTHLPEHINKVEIFRIK